MLRFRTLAAAVSAGATLAAGASPVAAGGDSPVGTQVLDLLCVIKGGAPVFTPFTISRCQEARPRDGCELERLICDGLVGGEFQHVSSPNRPSRTNWFCFVGPIHA